MTQHPMSPSNTTCDPIPSEYVVYFQFPAPIAWQRIKDTLRKYAKVRNVRYDGPSFVSAGCATKRDARAVFEGVRRYGIKSHKNIPFMISWGHVRREPSFRFVKFGENKYSPPPAVFSPPMPWIYYIYVPPMEMPPVYQQGHPGSYPVWTPDMLHMGIPDPYQMWNPDIYQMGMQNAHRMEMPGMIQRPPQVGTVIPEESHELQAPCMTESEGRAIV